MLIRYSDGVALAVSIVVWPLIGLGTGLWFHRWPIDRLDHDNWLTRPRAFEDHGRWYQRRLRIRRWKDRLPEKGDLFRGGFSKRHLSNRTTAHLERFAAETRRAELVHWSNLAAGPVFLVWCPPLLGSAMIGFAVVAHLPFVAIQRYNRQRLASVLARRERRSIRDHEHR